MASTLRRIKLGSQGLEVLAQGLGCMGMPAFYGLSKSDSDMITLIHHAVHSGVTFLDTSDIDGPHTDRILLGKAPEGGVRPKVESATTFGVRLVDEEREVRGDLPCVTAAVGASLKRPAVDCTDLYCQHLVDPGVPVEVTARLTKHIVRFISRILISLV